MSIIKDILIHAKSCQEPGRTCTCMRKAKNNNSLVLAIDKVVTRPRSVLSIVLFLILVFKGFLSQLQE